MRKLSLLCVVVSLFSIIWFVNQKNEVDPLDAMTSASEVDQSADSLELVQETVEEIAEVPEIPGVMIEVQPSDTLDGILEKQGISREQRLALSRALRQYRDPRTFKPGDRFEVLFAEGTDDNGMASVERFRMVADRDSLVELTLADQAFVGSLVPLAHSISTRRVDGTIRSSFFLAANRQGVAPSVSIEFYNMLGERVDFQRDLREGDKFSMVYEEKDDGPFGGIHAGRLLQATLTLSGQSMGFYRFTTGDGYTGFFDETGTSVDTRLMKRPLNEGVLSSLFGKRRHPILGYAKMHRGVDYAARRGTPILASGDGVIEKSKWNGSYGKFILIRHGSKYQTAYAHLSRFAPGIKRGTRVKQGDVIGYVGNTGRSTGPHLHYEVRLNGKRINPMKLDLPPVRTLTGEELDRFRGIVKKYSPLAGQSEV